MSAKAGPAPFAGTIDGAAALEAARRVVRQGASAIEVLETRLDERFVDAVRRVATAPGRVIVSGIGKSGIVARKLAATLTSTGTPATFLHPVEGLHGDLGIVSDGDVAIMVSKSGESNELASLIDHLTRRGVTIIALTGRMDSTLARSASLAIDVSVAEEACPFDLAPTTSTTAAMAMGDALAVALLTVRGFSRDDFARLHPGGSLGRKLTLRVRDVMLTDDLPKLPPDAPMRRCVVLLAEKRGTVAIVDPQDRVVGVVTSGDLTRLLEQTEDIFDLPVSRIMTRSPRTTDGETFAASAIYKMETHGIMAMPVTDADGVLEGIVHLHDLLRSGVI